MNRILNGELPTPRRRHSGGAAALRARGVLAALIVSQVVASAQLPPPDLNEFPRLPVLVQTNGLVRQANSYIIAPNDVIWLKVYQEDDLETQAKVNKDGLVTIPLLGAVGVAGKSVDQATEMIRKELDRRFIVNPQVSLSVLEYSKRRFTILGQVGRPGVYEYPGDEKLTVLQAIAMAGGFTQRAAPSKVRIQRVEAGQSKTYKVDAEEGSKDPEAGPFQIKPDDTIRVGSRWF